MAKTLISAADAKTASNVTFRDARLERIESSIAYQIEAACMEGDLTTFWTGATPAALRTKLESNGYALTAKAGGVIISWA